MRVLFVHNNFPAQFRRVARALLREPGAEVAAIGSSTACEIRGVKLLRYQLPRIDASVTHPFGRRFNLECYRGEQVLYALSALRSTRYLPDIIVAHPGWGETLPLRTVFPEARLILYCEFYYGAHGRDVGFDPEFPATGTDGLVALQLKNASTLLALAESDCGISPTAWQRSTFPSEYQSKIRVVHEGVDVDFARPAPHQTFQLSSKRTLTRADEVVTFVARNLEPLRGYHVFMRSLPEIMRRRPHAEIVVIGGSGTSYGAPPPPGTSWKSIFFDEIRDRVDESRIHFLGYLPYNDYIRALQVSSVHIYFTYPFVLSWSLLDAMSVGCLVLGSDTAPVQEIINGINGILVPFFDYEQLAWRVIDALAQPAQYLSFRAKARETIISSYDADRICLPKILGVIRELAGQRMNARSGRLSIGPVINNRDLTQYSLQTPDISAARTIGFDEQDAPAA